MLWQKIALGVFMFVGLVVYQNVRTNLDYYNVASTSIAEQKKSSLSLVPGELPGYTGWARPAWTLAGNFEIVSEPSLAQVGKEWTMTISCQLEECLQGGAHFFVRAYGPAVITGQVHDNYDGSYDIQLLVLDPGQYTLEVVLVCSHAPEWEAFPLQDGPAYEGYLLQGFPMQLHVEPYTELAIGTSSADLCTFDQLVESDHVSAYGKRRWVVVDRVANRRFSPNDQDISLEGYQSGKNSLGIMMDYLPNDCSLLAHRKQLGGTKKFNNLVDTCFSRGDNNNNVHIIMIGDSVTLMQQKQMEASLVGGNDHAVKFNTTQVTTSGGIRVMYESVIQELEMLKKTFPQERRFVMFNTGLHDVAQLCSERYAKARRKYINQMDRNFSCVREYKRYFKRLVNYIKRYPAELRVFQSTTAAWPRYGNFGFGWTPDMKQYFSMSSNFVAHFNEIAYEIVSTAQGVHAMDTYWMTLARPDNRQVDFENAIGKHLVHPGLEVMNAMGRIWWMLILRAACGDDLDEINNEFFK